MTTENYPSKYRDPAITVEHIEDDVLIWVANAGGQTFTKEQWTALIISEFHRLELGQEWA